MDHLNPFTFFKVSQALQLHFKKPDFDWFKIGQIRCAPNKFDSRADAKKYAYLASRIKAKDIVQFHLANNLDNKTNPVYNFDEAIKNFSQYTKKLISLSNNFKQDLDGLGNELELMKKSVDKLFLIEYNRHPMIVQRFLGGKISLETMVLIDKFCRPFVEELDETFVKDFVWEKISTKIRKYSPFLDGKDWIVFSDSRIKMIWHDFVKDCETNLLL